MSKTTNRMRLVEAALASGPQSYYDLTVATGLSAAAVSRAVVKLSQEAGVCLAVPCSRNGYQVSLGWDNAARIGEANQAKHNATRNERQAKRLDNAAGVVSNPSEALVVQMLSRFAATHARAERDFADAMEAMA